MIKDDRFASRKWWGFIISMIIISFAGVALVLTRIHTNDAEVLCTATTLLFGTYCGANIGEKVGGALINRLLSKKDNPEDI